MNKDEQLTYDNAKILKAISHPIRLCLVKHLAEGERNVTYFVDCMGASQANISQHLAKLRENDIVETRKVKNEVYYSLTSDVVKTILDILYSEK